MENIQDIYPLSPMQEGMLFHSLYSPDSEVYKEQFSCKLIGSLDRSAFKSSWQKVIERHDILRTAFVWEEVDEVLQIVHKAVELPFIYLDYSDISDQKNEIVKLLEENHKEKIDFSKAPLMKITLLKLADQEHLLVWDHHHILFDGWGLSVLIQEIMQIYSASLDDKEPDLKVTHNYKDEERTRKFWEKRLKGFTKPTYLKFPQSGKPQKGYLKKGIIIDDSLFDKIKEINFREKITTNTLIQASWSLLLTY